MSIFFYSGGMAQCRQMICDAGGIETEFPKGVDIFPHLIRNNLCLFIDEGYLDARLMTPGMGAYELVSYTSGSFLIGDVFWGKEFSLTHYELIPETRLKGICIPRHLLMTHSEQSYTLWTKLFQMFKELSYIHSVNTVLFHAEKGINRVCNYLWIYDAIRQTGAELPGITQEKIVGKTLLSQSQVTRVLSELRQEGIIDTNYRKVQVRDRETMAQLVSPLCLNPDFMDTII